MDLHDRVLFITKIAKEQPNIGKTAMMKCLYLLQAVEKVPLEYSFEIYTYGPYSSEAMSEIDHANQNGYIDVSGYCITCCAKGDAILSKNDTVNAYRVQINNIVDTYSGKTARELELLSTIVFIARLHIKNGWDMSKEDICGSVEEVKPQFTQGEIAANYLFLLENQHLDRALH